MATPGRFDRYYVGDRELCHRCFQQVALQAAEDGLDYTKSGLKIVRDDRLI